MHMHVGFYIKISECHPRSVWLARSVSNSEVETCCSTPRNLVGLDVALLGLAFEAKAIAVAVGHRLEFGARSSFKTIPVELLEVERLLLLGEYLHSSKD